MKKSLLYITAASLLMFSACAPSEDPITPSGNYSVLRMTFPQGNNPWDEEIKEIHDKYGVYLLYKDITPADLNRKWTSVGTGLLYYGDDVPDNEVQYYVDFFKDHVFPYFTPEVLQTSFPVKIYLMKDLHGVEQDLGGGGSSSGGSTGTGTGGTSTGTGTGGSTGTGTGGSTGTGTGGTSTGTGTGGTSTGTGTGGTSTGTGTGGTSTGTGTGGTSTGTGTGGTSTGTGTGGTSTGTGTGGTSTGTGTGGTSTGTGGTGTGGTGTGGTGTGATPSYDPDIAGFTPIKFDGFDYWAISFSNKELAEMKTDKAKALKTKRYSFINQIITPQRKDGTIAEPEGFREGIDFTKSWKKNNPNDPGYPPTLGFIPWIDDNGKEKSWSSMYATYYKTPNYNSGSNYYDYFMSYVRAAMIYTTEEFYAKYPKDKYPIISRQYETVVKYMKDKYGLDLPGIAKGPTSTTE